MSLAGLWAKFVGLFIPTSSDTLDFTPRAQQLLAHARREAIHRHHREIDIIHLLLALLRLEKSAGCDTLRRLGGDSVVLGRELEPLASPGKDIPEAGPIPYSYNIKKTLAYAVREAKALNHRHVGTDHLLLGVLRLGEEPAAKILLLHSISIARAREDIRAQKNGDPPVSELPPA